MNGKKSNAQPVLIVGNGSLTYSIAACLLKAKYVVRLCTNNVEEGMTAILTHFSEMQSEDGKAKINMDSLKVSDNFKKEESYELAILITAEEISIKKDAIARLEATLPPDTTITINTESIHLDMIQENSIHPERIIGLNWTEPAHTTHFLEIITNSSVRNGLAVKIGDLAKSWNKDPYVVDNFGIRARLLSAMVREAFYLVENGYATVEDIDRACRNDAGYYLPFAGNCRYMDLMGTYAYGIVMKDLNPDLSKEQRLPDFFMDIINKGGLGMQNGKGFYRYTTDEINHWEEVVREFSYQIEEIINKYPFSYKNNMYK